MMKKVVIKKDAHVIKEENIDYITAIYAKKDGKLKGLVIKEDRGWVLRIGGELGGYGYYDTRKDCITDGIKDHGYTFFVED